MSNSQKILQETAESIYTLKENIQKAQELKNTNEIGEGIYVFISFDLINSTLFKSRHMDLWPGFISAFYSAVAEVFGVSHYRGKPVAISNFPYEKYCQMIEKTEGFKVWKLVGDEVLLYHMIVSKEELYNTIIYVDQVRKELIKDAINIYLDKMYPGNCQEDLNESNNTSEGVEKTGDSEESNKNVAELDLENIQSVSKLRHLFLQYFDVKTTIWIGSCANDSKRVNLERPNLIYDTTNYNHENTMSFSQPDFLGPDIDEGFRLCEFAEKGKMLVSPKLVRLLLLANKDDIDKMNVLNLNFRIVNYAVLKGVWEQRPYPLIMFCQSDMNKGPSIDNWKANFEYDAFETSFLYKNIDKYGELFLQDKKFSVSNLNDIYEHVFREEEMDVLYKLFKKQESAIAELKDSDRMSKSINRKFEFHVSCLCYDKVQNKFWITNNKNHGWSFGCLQVKQNKEYYEQIKDYYKRKCGLHILIDDKSPILSFYSADRPTASGESILGVMVLTCCQSISGTNSKDEKDEQDENLWLSYEEAKGLEGKKITNYDLALDKANKIITLNDEKTKSS